MIPSYPLGGLVERLKDALLARALAEASLHHPGAALRAMAFILESRQDRDKFSIDEGKASIRVRRLGSNGDALKCDPRGRIRRSAPQKSKHEQDLSAIPARRLDRILTTHFCAC
jgi:hypothetical protein